MTNTPPKSAGRRIANYGWRVVRVFLIAYLAACLITMARETSLIYPAPAVTRGNWETRDPPHEDVWFTSADGTKLNGWFLPNPRSKRAILYCHGNGEHCALDADLAAQVHEQLKAAVFIFDYRGYGRSEGRPYEAGLIADGQAARAWLAERLAIKPNEIVLMGHSLGGGVATALAAEGGARALVLENTFSTMVDAAADMVWWLPVKLIMRNRYDSVARIKQYPGPLFQSHGTNDTLIPFRFGKLLFEAAPTTQKRFIENTGRGHDDPPPELLPRPGRVSGWGRRGSRNGGIAMSGPAASSPKLPAGRRSWLRRALWVGRWLAIGYLLLVLAAMLGERWLVYRAPPVDGADWQATGIEHEGVWFASADGTRLNGWFFRNQAAKRTILYCHGNAEQVADDAGLAVRLRDRLQANVFVFDYRGYGRSLGTPTEAACIADAQAARRWLAVRLNLQPNQIVIYGRSLGGGIAVALAADGGTPALILENTFSTMVDVAAGRYPYLPVRVLMRNRYDSITRIRRYEGPLFQSHGTADTHIPIGLARQLFAAAPTANKRFVELAGKGHEDWPAADYYSEVAAFLDEVDE